MRPGTPGCAVASAHPLRSSHCASAAATVDRLRRRAARLDDATAAALSRSAERGPGRRHWLLRAAAGGDSPADRQRGGSYRPPPGLAARCPGTRGRRSIRLDRLARPCAGVRSPTRGRSARCPGGADPGLRARARHRSRWQPAPDALSFAGATWRQPYRSVGSWLLRKVRSGMPPGRASGLGCRTRSESMNRCGAIHAWCFFREEPLSELDAGFACAARARRGPDAGPVDRSGQGQHSVRHPGVAGFAGANGQTAKTGAGTGHRQRDRGAVRADYFIGWAQRLANWPDVCGSRCGCGCFGRGDAMVLLSSRLSSEMGWRRMNSGLPTPGAVKARGIHRAVTAGETVHERTAARNTSARHWKRSRWTIYSLTRAASASGVQVEEIADAATPARRAAGQEHGGLHCAATVAYRWQLRPGAVEGEEILAAQNVVFQPGVNEELAATATWGTQQLGFTPAAAHKFDGGILASGTARAPGVDRTADVFKHANLAYHAVGRRSRGGRRRPRGQELHGGAPERPHLQGLRTAGVLSGERARDPRPGPACVCDEPLCRPVDQHEDHPGDRRIQRHGRDRSAAGAGAHPRRLRDAARRAAHPLARHGAGRGSAPVRLQVVCGARVRACQPPELQRDRRTAGPLRHHRQRQGLQRHATGLARS